MKAKISLLVVCCLLISSQLFSQKESLQNLIGEWTSSDVPEELPNVEGFKWVYTPTVSGKGVRLKNFAQSKNQDDQLLLEVMMTPVPNSNKVLALAIDMMGNTIVGEGVSEENILKVQMYTSMKSTTPVLSIEYDISDNEVTFSATEILPDGQQKTFEYHFKRIQ